MSLQLSKIHSVINVPVHLSNTCAQGNTGKRPSPGNHEAQLFLHVQSSVWSQIHITEWSISSPLSYWIEALCPYSLLPGFRIPEQVLITMCMHHRLYCFICSFIHSHHNSWEYPTSYMKQPQHWGCHLLMTGIAAGPSAGHVIPVEPLKGNIFRSLDCSHLDMAYVTVKRTCVCRKVNVCLWNTLRSLLLKPCWSWSLLVCFRTAFSQI